MDTIFDKLLKAVNDLNAHVSGTVDEVRKCKKDISDLRDDMYNHLTQGYYIRDNNRIILSAPEIIIGNVDKAGVMYSNSSVTIRTSNLNMEAVGEAGNITAKGNNVAIYAEDPGPDGQEAVVHDTSAVKILAKGISLDSNASKKAFSHKFVANPAGLSLHSDTGISVISAQRRTLISDELDRQIGELNTTIGTLTTNAASKQTELTQKLDQLKADLVLEDPMCIDGNTTYLNSFFLDSLTDKLNTEATAFLNLMASYIGTLSKLAEAKRKLAAFQEQKSNLPSEDQIKKQSNGCNVSIEGELISISSKDGNGSMRTDANSGVRINAPHTAITSIGDDNRNIPDSSLKMHTQNVTISTANVKSDDKDKKEEEATFQADGKVNILTKELNVAATDYKQKDQDPYHMEKLAEGGAIKVNVDKVKIDTANEKGDASGSFSLNSKKVKITGMSVEADTRKRKELGRDSTFKVLSDNIFIGDNEDKTKTSRVQMVAQDVINESEKSMRIKQGDAVVDMSEGKTKISSAENDIFGKTVIKGDTEIEAKTSMSSAEVKELKVSSKLSAPNAEFGAGAGGAKTGSYSIPKWLKKIEIFEDVD